jgi:hypothetical protein
MKGQWIGKYSGTTEGDLILNIDEMEDNFKGMAFARPANKALPRSVSLIETKDKNRNFSFSAFIFPIDPRSGVAADWREVGTLFPDVEHTKTLEVVGKFTDTQLRICARESGFVSKISLRFN